jgi:hypothetical protein
MDIGRSPGLYELIGQIRDFCEINDIVLFGHPERNRTSPTLPQEFGRL